MKKLKNIFLGLVVAMPLMVSQEAFAGHYHGSYRSNHYHGHRYVHRTYRPRVVHRRVYRPYYRPYYQPVAHYHYGFLDPCFDHAHSSGIYWNVNVGSGGVGFGVQSGW